MTGVAQPTEALRRIEAYYDAAPRSAADVEEFPPLRLFVQRGGGWPYYARPALGTDARTIFLPEHIARVRGRQRELGVPESFEWTHEIVPGLRAAVEAAGVEVHTHRLMVLDPAARQRAASLDGVSVSLVSPDLSDDVLALIGAVASVGFASHGTDTGHAGLEALAATTASTTPAQLAHRRDRLRRGDTVMVVARTAEGPVATGAHQPVAGVSEIVGVATLPAYRRRGIGAAVVDLLIEDALRRGAETIFLTAGDETVARVYHRLGFRRIATGCIAETP
ncbi:MAG TPA: GNAT family N-acetyltransferase [Chloroflexota bacterium]|nr:GNAT family N-acetyltransferase [Chloroflexota bacterium]